jgi:hypothetical protein
MIEIQLIHSILQHTFLVSVGIAPKLPCYIMLLSQKYLGATVEITSTQILITL